MVTSNDPQTSKPPVQSNLRVILCFSKQTEEKDMKRNFQICGQSYPKRFYNFIFLISIRIIQQQHHNSEFKDFILDHRQLFKI